MHTIKEIVFNTNYTKEIPNGWFPRIPKESDQQKTTAEKDKIQKTTKTKGTGIFASISSAIDGVLWNIFPSVGKKNKTNAKTEWKTTSTKEKEENPAILNQDLKSQVKYILELPDNEYSEKKLTTKLRQYITEIEKHYNTVINDYKSHIATSYRELKGNEYNVWGMFGKTYYVQSFPSYMDALRTRDILGFHAKRDMSFFIYPEDDSAIQSMLKQKVTQLKSEIKEASLKWITMDTEVEQQYRDIEMIREKLTTREERYFEMGYYTNIYDSDPKKIQETGKKFEQKVAGYGIRVKSAIQRMDQWFTTWLPLCKDDLGIVRSSITSSIAGSFPFIADDLVSETWILYGVNTQTGWLVIFDRFNAQLENMNSVILATSGAGKSFTVKLEALRYLLNGIEIIVIDPENEYKALCDKVGGTYINIATSSQQFLNPFDIPPEIEDVDYWPWDLLRAQVVNLSGMIELLIGKLSPEEEAILDKALQSTYTLKWFSFEATTYEGKQPPIMEDLMNVLEWMDGWDKVALRLSKYVNGTFGKLFNNYTNIDINSAMTVFSIRDLEEALKTPAMYNVINFIRTKIRSKKKKRMLIVDEAWIMLQNEISANFLFSLIKRARKYGVWVTTISQDIEDFVRSKYGKPIVSNSALQILLKQSTTSIKTLQQLLGLSEAEQQRLVASNVWEWLIFAWSQHVPVQILASPREKDFISTDVS